MITLPLASQIQNMLPVLKLFLIPVGGGIPAGVMLARANDLAWPITTGLYLISDIILALAFEPILRLLAALAGRIPFLARFRAAFKEVSARSAAHIWANRGVASPNSKFPTNRSHSANSLLKQRCDISSSDQIHA